MAIEKHTYDERYPLSTHDREYLHSIFTGKDLLGSFLNRPPQYGYPDLEDHPKERRKKDERKLRQ